MKKWRGCRPSERNHHRPSADLLARYRRLCQASQMERMRWLIGFSERALDGLSRRDWQVLGYEAAGFALFGLWRPEGWKYLSLMHFPSELELRKAQHWLHMAWQRLFHNHCVIRRVKNWAEALTYTPQGLDLVPFSRRKKIWPEGFESAIFRTVVAGKDSFRFCHYDKCHRPFVAHKRQAYCSPACSQAFRTRRYRTEKRERFRAKRREAYARKQKEKFGFLNIRIQGGQQGGHDDRANTHNPESS